MYRTLLLVRLSFGFISFANLASRSKFRSEPSTGFRILAGSRMLGVIMRFRQRHLG
jgi:hypothetical protein